MSSCQNSKIKSTPTLNVYYKEEWWMIKNSKFLYIRLWGQLIQKNVKISTISGFEWVGWIYVCLSGGAEGWQTTLTISTSHGLIFSWNAFLACKEASIREKGKYIPYV